MESCPLCPNGAAGCPEGHCAFGDRCVIVRGQSSAELKARATCPVVEIDPEDQLLIETEAKLAQEQVAHISEAIKKWMQGEVQNLVLPQELRLVAVLRRGRPPGNMAPLAGWLNGQALHWEAHGLGTEEERRALRQWALQVEDLDRAKVG